MKRKSPLKVYSIDILSKECGLNKEISKKVLDFFKDSKSNNLIPKLKKIKGIHRVIWERGVLTIHKKKEIIKIHKLDTQINELIDIKDRIYIGKDNPELVIKIYDSNPITKPTQNKFILGITRTDSHDSSAVLLKNGKILGAIEEERLNRFKHTRTPIPELSINYLLSTHKVSWQDISHIAIGWDYNFYVDTPHSQSGHDRQNKKLKYPISNNEKDHRQNPKTLKNLIKKVASTYKSKYIPPVTFVSHHKAHAISATDTSGLKGKSLIVILDGRGEDESVSIWLKKYKDLKKIGYSSYPNSLGFLYRAMTKAVGYSNHDQGKVMGLSPYGSPENAKEKELVKKYWKLLEKYISFNNSIEKLTIKEDLFNFNSKHSAGLKFSNHFYKKLYSISPIFKKKIKGMQINPKLEEHRPYINFIYTVQKFSEEMVFKIVKHFFKKHPEGKSAQNLIIAGGFALNIVSNGNIISSGLVNPKNFYVPAFPADNGSSIGAALSIAAEEYGFKTKQSLENVSLGKEYTNKEVERALKQFKLVKNKDFKFYKEKDLIKETISLLVKNKTIAWFNGGSEFGPRALGNRSILHLLTDPKGNDKVNKIKLRESWRPSALSITENSAPKFIEGIHKAPFMVIAFPIKKSKRNIIISGKHPYPGDETTRPQTVSKKVNPRYWTLLKDVGKKTGVPGLLNTSFNRREPIVELPEEAINTFYYSKGIDALVIENFILFRNEKLEPSIISISEENSVKNSFSKAISSNNKISWDIFWKDLNSLAEKRKPQHFVEVKVNKKKFKMPLFKEIFDQGINNKILQDIFQRRVKNTKREKIHIKTTMEQYKRALEIIFE